MSDVCSLRTRCGPGRRAGDRVAHGPVLLASTTHKLDNLKDHCPRHARPEMKRDYDRIIYATDALAARAAYDAFLKKWSTLCPAVATSLAEAGLDLLTFYDFPKATWK